MSITLGELKNMVINYDIMKGKDRPYIEVKKMFHALALSFSLYGIDETIKIVREVR